MNNDRLRFRVFNKENKRYDNHPDYDIYLQQDGGFVISGWKHNSHFSFEEMPDLIFEFCTGMKDKNARLAFEFDLIKPPNDYFYEGEFDRLMVIREHEGCYYAMETHDAMGKKCDDTYKLICEAENQEGYYAFLWDIIGESEIIGNINEPLGKDYCSCGAQHGVIDGSHQCTPNCYRNTHKESNND